MPKSKRIYAPIKSYPFSKNRLLIIDFGSLSYHQIYALFSYKKSKYYRDDINTPEDEKSRWKTSMINRFLDMIKLFNPIDIVIAMDGTNSWRNKIFEEYYKNNSKITYDKSGFYIAYDNDVVKITKENDQYKSEKLKDKTNIPTREIKYEEIPERLIGLIGSVLPKYKETRKKKVWEFLMSKKEFNELRIDFSKDLSKIFRSYRIIIDNAEGDDIIYTVFNKLKDSYDSTVLVTRDSDMNQLLTSEKLVIYNHLTEEIDNCLNPEDYLQIKVLGGDTSDSIPGILIPGNKKKLGEAGAKTFYESLGNESCFNVAQRQGWEAQYVRNRQLIDLSFCPIEIQKEIISVMESSNPEFCPFWEIESMGLPKKTLSDIGIMKNLGYYTMCNKEDMKKNPNLFNPERKDFKEFTKEDESKVLTRVGDSSDFDGIF